MECPCSFNGSVGSHVGHSCVTDEERWTDRSIIYMSRFREKILPQRMCSCFLTIYGVATPWEMVDLDQFTGQEQGKEKKEEKNKWLEWACSLHCVHLDIFVKWWRFSSCPSGGALLSEWICWLCSSNHSMPLNLSASAIGCMKVRCLHSYLCKKETHRSAEELSSTQETWRNSQVSWWRAVHVTAHV